MKRILGLALVALSTQSAFGAEIFFANTRINKVTQYHTTVGTSAAAAIPSASVAGNVVSFKVCNDAVNTSTYLFVGQATDPATDGQSLGLGQCFVCENCQPAVLKLIKVKAQAASNGYSVIQFSK